MRYLRAFGAFWYDFLVGDRLELFLGSLAILALIWWAVRLGLSPSLAGLLLALLVLGLGGFSVWLATRHRR
jgi:hypothetical protein